MYTGQTQDRRLTRPFHRHNYSLFSVPPSLTSSSACIDSDGPRHLQQPVRSNHDRQSVFAHRPTRSVPKAFYAPNRDKPLPPITDTDTDTLRGQEEGMNISMTRERVDVSQGSWLENGAYLSSQENSVEDGNPFDLEDYLVSPVTSGSHSHSHEISPIPARELRRPRAPTLPTTLTPIAQATEASFDRRDYTFVQQPLVPIMSSPFRPTPIQTDSSAPSKTGLGRSASDGEILYDNSPHPFARPPKAATLPDPSNFPDPYPHGLVALHHPPTTMPALSSAGSSSASTRSSAYTNPGSTISGNGISGDYSNVRVASGDDVDGLEGGIGLGITSDTMVTYSRASNGSSLSSGSRKSHVSPMERVRRTDITRARRSLSQSEDISPLASFERPSERTLKSQPSYDTSWQRDHDDREDFITSEEEFEFGDHQDNDEEEEVEKENDRTAAIVVAEEGRGLIVRGDGAPVSSITIQPGITHLLVGKSSTPNQVPAFLNSTLPQICSTLLALDISANFLALLSPALAACTSLEELNVSSNPLRALPEFLCELTSLRVLIADSTGISTIPGPLAELQKLHTLSIRRNKMHALPSWLCTLPCLESLLVDDNPFQGPWKALVEPLLAKTPMTPMYPPSTPMFPQLSASSTAATSEAVTDISDADYTDQEDLNGNSPPPSLPPSAQVDRHFTAIEDEEHTITPASARQLERASSAATIPIVPHSPPLPAPQLARTRTTPSRNYYERNRDSRQQSPSKSTMTWAGDRTGDPEMSIDPLPAMPAVLSPPKQERGELRRMRSADELRRALQGVGASSQPESPPRPNLPPYATSTIGSKFSENLDTLTQQRKFASPGVNSRGPSRAGNRPLLLNSMWGEQSIDEDADADADVESPPRPTRSRPATPVTRRDRGLGQDDGDTSIPQNVALHKLKSSEKGKSGSRRWGFFKKMSMGKLRPVESSDIPPTPPAPSRPQTTHDGTPLSQSTSGRARAQTFQESPRKFVPPQLDVEARAPEAGPSSLPALSLSMPTLKQKASTDRLRIPATPQTPSSGGLLAPPSPMPRSAKRRSFLPIDGPPSLNIPIPSTGPFLGSVTVTNGSPEENGEAPRETSPIVQSPEEMQRKEEDRAREANVRALRSVMAYLKDMNDLTLLSQGNPMSIYGGTPPMDRIRRPTLAEGSRMQSEASIDSIDSASSAPTSGSSQLRSIDSMTLSRSGSSGATMSMITTDSGGSNGEERKSKDDRSKRVMVVREIVETERTYVKSLQELVDIYIRPAALPVTSISSVASSSKETVVPAAERKIVFDGLESLFLFHKNIFLPALETAATPLLQSDGLAADADTDGRLSSEVAMGVGRMFVSHAAFMKMYSTYINNFENSVQRIRTWLSDRPGPSASPSGSITPSSSSAQLANLGLAMSAISAPNSVHEMSPPGKTATLSSSQRKRIKTYLKRCRINPRHSQLNLEGYLLLPVQRIPRYRLLLEELGRSTPPPTDSFDDPLERALNEISSLATNMNEGKREAESRRKLVQWQARIRGKFPSPLVQPHRRLIMDGKLTLTRIVRKQTMSFEVLDSHGDTASVAVDCLAPEPTPRPLYGILCNDLFVLCRDPSNGLDANSPVDLWAVLRMQTMPHPTSIVHGNTLRIVDTKAILYLEAQSTSDALTWFRAINMHVPASSPSA